MSLVPPPLPFPLSHSDFCPYLPLQICSPVTFIKTTPPPFLRDPCSLDAIPFNPPSLERTLQRRRPRAHQRKTSSEWDCEVMVIKKT